MPIFKPRPNGNVIVDEIIEDLSVNGLKDLKVIKCPNLYGTAFEVWESQDLATIFGTATTVEPFGDLVFASVLGNNYYDTYTGTITVGTGNNITITNTGESAVDIYVVDLTTLFTTEPTETQMDDMTKMFLFNGTGQELITLESVWYVDYVAQVIHNLTTIYDAGNEPTLSEHEALIPQYTNIVLKAKSFENTLQQEYMAVSLDTPIYEGLSLRDIFEDGNLVVNEDVNSDNIIDSFTKGTNIVTYNYTNGVQTFTTSGSIASIGNAFYGNYGSETNTLFLSLSVKRNNDVGTNNFQFRSPNTRLIVNETLSTDYTTYSNIYSVQIDKQTRFGSLDTGLNISIKDIYIINLSLFTTAPTKSQLDEWLDMYLLLTANNPKTGTDFVQDRYYIDYDNAKVYDYNVIAPYLPTTLDTIVYEGKSYRDIFETGSLIKETFDTFSGWSNSNYFTYDSLNKNIVFNGFTSNVLLYKNISLNGDYYVGYELVANNSPSLGIYDGVSYISTTNVKTTGLIGEIVTSVNGTRFSIAISSNTGANSVFDNIFLIPLSLFTTAPTQTQLDTWLQTYLYLTNRKQVMEDIIAKTITLTAIPVKVKIYKDRFVILGEYVIIGE